MFAALALGVAVLACGATGVTDDDQGASAAGSHGSASLPQGAWQRATATLTGAASPSISVSWSVAEGSAGGSVSSSGLYSAPSSAGTFHVVATSTVDPRVTASAAVTVRSGGAVSVAVTPASAVVAPGGTQVFTAAVLNATNTAVTWSLQEGAAGGGISSSGTYTAPAATGTYHVVATSVADASASAVVPITVSSTGVVRMPVISWGVPAYTQNGSAGSNANSATHATTWRSGGYPTYLAYDLSSVPSASRQRVYVQWWNPVSYGYNQASTYNLPGSYVLEGNAAAGGSLPSSGWVQLNDDKGKPISVTGNGLSNRAHVAMLNGMNWIRFRATAGASGNNPQNTDCQIAMDVSDAHLGIEGWHFVGDSITGLWAPQSTKDFTEVIKSSTGGTYEPSFDADGIPGLTSANYPFSAYLPLWPGKYVGVQLGANDSGSNPSAYYANMITLVDALLAAGKTVMIATPSWQSVAMGHQDMSKLAAQVPLLVAHYQALGKPVYAGPDLYAYFSQPANQTYITSNDGLHPSSAGAALMASLWAQAAINTFY